MTNRLPMLTGLIALAGVLCLAWGCADDARHATTRPGDSGDAVLRDPFNYKPFANDPDISGGSLGHYDKDAMQKDLKHVFDP